MKKFIKTASATALTLAPFLVLAQLPVSITGKSGIEQGIDTIGRILSSVVPIMVTLAVIYFFYGLGKYILAQGSEEAKGEGKAIMIYGVIALFVMVSVWGIVKLIQTTFGIETIDAQGFDAVPDVTGDGGSILPRTNFRFNSPSGADAINTTNDVKDIANLIF